MISLTSYFSGTACQRFVVLRARPKIILLQFPWKRYPTNLKVTHRQTKTKTKTKTKTQQSESLASGGKSLPLNTKGSWAEWKNEEVTTIDNHEQRRKGMSTKTGSNAFTNSWKSNKNIIGLASILVTQRIIQQVCVAFKEYIYLF